MKSLLLLRTENVLCSSLVKLWLDVKKLTEETAEGIFILAVHSGGPIQAHESQVMVMRPAPDTSSGLTIISQFASLPLIGGTGSNSRPAWRSVNLMETAWFVRDSDWSGHPSSRGWQIPSYRERQRYVQMIFKIKDLICRKSVDIKLNVFSEYCNNFLLKEWEEFVSSWEILTYNCNLLSEAVKDDIKLREELTNINRTEPWWKEQGCCLQHHCSREL